jgi:hypothetical protein
VRADNGKAISNQKPNFVAGVAGGSGGATVDWSDEDLANAAVWPLSATNFVSVLIGNSVTTGGSQALRHAKSALLDLVDCVIRRPHKNDT